MVVKIVVKGGGGARAPDLRLCRSSRIGDFTTIFTIAAGPVLQFQGSYAVRCAG